ncbi:hypothetical protein [Pelomonas sp. Root1237]|uniref:hypothetical protein n=1 Tax=Pelomonas sp. Root1237 TaxID=1736434 RepID=UPI0006F914FE|nr:hypothetical protein [Pelomonas sp. Root1237]KQV88364.1 hypothetical protein ASC91_16300 [Pelomonas sp. Root1237]
MFAKEWAVRYNDHSIVVRNSLSLTGSTEAKLYIDGSKVDSTTDRFAMAGTPVLRGAIKREDGPPEEVEVYAKSGLFSVKIRICVGGKQVFSDGF